MVPTTASSTAIPIRMVAGMARKNTCSCGISRESTPTPRLNRMPKAMNGAAS
jgi:hypothetical protein